jgi:hypothetical protein
MPGSGCVGPHFLDLATGFTPGLLTPGAHFIGGWVNIRSGLNAVERKNLHPPGLKLQSPGCPTRQQSVYQLRYPVEVKVKLRPTSVG